MKRKLYTKASISINTLILEDVLFQSGGGNNITWVNDIENYENLD